MKPVDDFGLRRELRGLRVDRSPGRDLWPEIRVRLPARRAARSGAATRRWGVALAACAVLAVAALVSVRMTTGPDAEPIAVQTDAAAGSAHQLDAADTLLTAYSELLALEGATFDRLPQRVALPGVAERMAAARELDASLAGLANALRVEPESQLLRRLMHQTLQQRLALTFDTPTA